RRRDRPEGEAAEPKRLAHAGDAERAGGAGLVANEHLAELEDAQPRLLASEVDAQHLDQAADEARAHHGERRGDRIDDADRRLAADEVALPALVDEAEADRLLPADTGHRVAQRARAAPRFARDLRLQRAERRPGRQGVVA